ncbi:MAG TPA: site-2 protease family protein [bacterium]|nr:site-2 protease family protein [bacterium]HOG38095.1 site-2 protease family protein [bacterium]HQI03151.1 site-2 protease family protein [bacterium]
MILNSLFTNPMLFIAWLVAIIFALTIHEFFHAYVALKQGDPTAKLMGRLSLNPLVHIDVFGFISILLVGFGWAKPVPVNPLYFKNKKWGDAIVSVAGPLSNFISATIFIMFFVIGVKLNIINYDLLINTINYFVGYGSVYNLGYYFLISLIVINIALGVFNLIPIPPLDGYHILFAVLPNSFNDVKVWLLKNGPTFLLIIILADSFLNIGVFSYLFNLIFNALGKLILG